MASPKGVSNERTGQNWFHSQSRLSVFLGIAILAVFAQLRLNFYLRIPTETDPGCFESIAYAMSQGQRLYLDVWDHKPPGIFYLNQWALEAFGSSEKSIFILQSITNTLIAVFLFLLLRLFVKSWLQVTLLGIFFFVVWMEPGKFGSGNYTEQYGLLFALVGHWSVCRYWLQKTSAAGLYIGALCFGIAILFKESFVFSALAIFPIILLEQDNWKLKLKRALFLGFGLFLPLGLYAASLFLQGHLDGWLSALGHTSKYAAHNVAMPLGERLWLNFKFFYSRVGRFMPWLCLLVLPMLLLWKRLPQSKFVSYFVLVLLLEFVATALPGNYYEHYYLPITATVFVLVAIALNHYYELLTLRNRKYGNIACIALLLVAAPTDFYRQLAAETAIQFPETGDGISKYLNANRTKGDRLAIANYDLGKYYLQSALQPVSRYPVPFNYHRIPEGQAKASANMGQIVQAKPRFIVGKEPFAEFLFVAGFNPWLKEHYLEVFSENDIKVWERR